MIIEVVEPFRVRELWMFLQPYIALSQLKGPTDAINADAMRDACATDETWRLIALHDGYQMLGAAVVRVLDDSLYVSALGGEGLPKDWHFDFFDWLRSAAQYMGLPAIRLGGRKGWRRKLAPLGFKPLDGPYLEARL